MPDERRRQQLYEELGGILTKESADELMSYLPPVGWADVATKADLGALRAELKGDIAKLDSRLDKVEGRFDKVDGRFDKVDGRFAKLDGRLDKLDGHVALKIAEGRQETRAWAVCIILTIALAMTGTIVTVLLAKT